MERWIQIDTILREIKKDDPTKFKKLEDDIDMLEMSPLKSFRNILKPTLHCIVPLGLFPIELESRGEKMAVTGTEIGTWMTASRAGTLAFSAIRHSLISSVLGR